MASRDRLVAVNRTIRAGELKDAGPYAAITDNARVLARKVDAVGVVDAPLNLLRLYDAALTKLQRAVDREIAARQARDRAEIPASSAAPAPDPSARPKLELVEESPLEKIRRKQRRAS